MLRLAVTLSLLCFSLQAGAAEMISGKVVSVADGDSLTVQTKERRRVRVRLFGIDAPERSQAFGDQSRQSLARLCSGKQATVRVRRYDQYRRALGQVYCGNISVEERQLEAGMAWVYRPPGKLLPLTKAPGTSRRKQSTVARERLIELEAIAKTARRGLWADPMPVPPWEFRRQNPRR